MRQRRNRLQLLQLRSEIVVDATTSIYLNTICSFLCYLLDYNEDDEQIDNNTMEVDGPLTESLENKLYDDAIEDFELNQHVIEEIDVGNLYFNIRS